MRCFLLITNSLLPVGHCYYHEAVFGVGVAARRALGCGLLLPPRAKGLFCSLGLGLGRPRPRPRPPRPPGPPDPDPAPRRPRAPTEVSASQGVTTRDSPRAAPRPSPRGNRAIELSDWHGQPKPTQVITSPHKYIALFSPINCNSLRSSLVAADSGKLDEGGAVVRLSPLAIYPLEMASKVGKIGFRQVMEDALGAGGPMSDQDERCEASFGSCAAMADTRLCIRAGDIPDAVITLAPSACDQRGTGTGAHPAVQPARPGGRSASRGPRGWRGSCWRLGCS
jgi:hypothetical protein